MSGLAKATLAEVEVRQGSDPRVTNEVEVQFNPASLRLSLTNENEGGRSRGRQARQFNGQSATELSFDLIFDTADEVAEDGTARSVRERTATVERFLLPRGEGSNKQAPPMVRFHWGHLVLDGVISSLSIEFGLFSPDGIPLRATMGVSIKEQDPKYTFLERGPGANQPPPGGSGDGRPGEPGTTGGPTDRSAPALAGESLADFASRQGLDPANWRALAEGGLNPLSLEAGVEIGFSASLSVGLGASVSAGIEVGASASLEASLGLEAEASASLDSGRALARSGGVAAALGTAASARAESAATASRRAFDAPAARSSGSGAGAAAAAAASGGASVSAGATAASGGGGSAGAPRISTQRAAPSSPDPRATAWGFGVPLRPRVTGAADERRRRLRGDARPGSVPGTATSAKPGTAPWTRLPAEDPGRKSADRDTTRKAETGPCACPCPGPGGR